MCLQYWPPMLHFVLCFTQGYFGAMGCMLELLKNEGGDHPLFTPIPIKPITKETIKKPVVMETQNGSAKFQNGTKDEIFVNGDCGIAHDSKTTSRIHSHKLHHSKGEGHSKKPTTLDLNSTSHDAMDLTDINIEINGTKQRNSDEQYHEKVSDKDHHTAL